MATFFGVRIVYPVSANCLNTLFYLILNITLGSRWCYSHFADKKNKAKRSRPE